MPAKQPIAGRSQLDAEWLVNGWSTMRWKAYAPVTRRFACAAWLVWAAMAQTRPGIFRIQPVRPVAELRAEALAARPPAEQGHFRASNLVELATLDPRIKL